jgi:HSP20 family protein
MRHDELFGEFDAMFVELAKRARTGRFEPNCDVYLNADETELIVELEIAGADPSELRVGLEQRHLFIVGRRSHRRRARPGDVLMKEIEYGDFIKKIHLPVPVAPAEVTASYQDGMLTIRLPVSQESRPPAHRTELQMTVRRISV